MTTSNTTNTASPSTDSATDGWCLIRTLRIGACACFAGWAWQHLRWSVPYDALLWNPDYMDWLANALGVSWEEYVAGVVTDRRILFGERILGAVFIAMAVLAVTVRTTSRVQLACLGIGGALLALVAFCLHLNAGNALPMFVEHGGQILAPVVLILALKRGVRDRWTIGTAMAAFGATFAGHGIYAVGLAPTPGSFYGMVNGILGLGEQSADWFLKIVGISDLIVCVGVFIPASRRPCLAYAALWGLLTALARPVAGMSLAAPWWGADQFIHEAVLRAPHATLPLFLFLVFAQETPPPSASIARGSSGDTPVAS